MIVPRPGWAEHRAEEDWWRDFTLLCRVLRSEPDPYARRHVPRPDRGHRPRHAPCDGHLRRGRSGTVTGAGGGRRGEKPALAAADPRHHRAGPVGLREHHRRGLWRCVPGGAGRGRGRSRRHCWDPKVRRGRSTIGATAGAAGYTNRPGTLPQSLAAKRPDRQKTGTRAVRRPPPARARRSGLSPLPPPAPTRVFQAPTTASSGLLSLPTSVMASPTRMMTS